MRQAEIERTGIPNLKIGYNKVFGYYIEVSNSHLDKVPPTYIRKQTLVNGERFITPELKEKEEIILHAEERHSGAGVRDPRTATEKVCQQARQIQRTAAASRDAGCACGIGASCCLGRLLSAANHPSWA